MKKYIIVLLVMLAVIACMGTAASSYTSGEKISVIVSDSGFSSSFSIVHDNENNATIYLYDGYDCCAMTVIPDWMLDPASNVTIELN